MAQPLVPSRLVSSFSPVSSASPASAARLDSPTSEADLAREADCARGDRATSPKVVQTDQHRLVLLAGMAHTIETVFEAIDNASERAWVETYIVRHDKLGHKLAEHLARARARGVDVRLLYDAVGSKNTDPRFFDNLRAAGVQVRCYRPPGPLYLSRGRLPRDHSRIVIIDQDGLTGGSAWGDEWLPCEQGGHGWHDVCIQLTGPGVGDLAHIFGVRWEEASQLDRAPSDCATGDLYSDLEIVSDSPTDRRMMLDRHFFRIRSATKRIWIENSYFFPPRVLLDELSRAAGRGVDVKVILPHETDLPNVQWAGRGEYDAWRQRGLQIYEYTRTVMHSKFAVIDDDWSTIGTFNINPVSLHWVNELNVFVHDRRFVAQVARLFERDLADSIRIDQPTADLFPAAQRARSFLFSCVYRGIEGVTNLLDRKHQPYIDERDDPAHKPLEAGCHVPDHAPRPAASSRPDALAQPDALERPGAPARPAGPPPDDDARANEPWRLAAQTSGGMLALFALVSALAYGFRAPLERLGHAFVERFGLLGMAVGTFLADGLHFPVPPQFYLLAAIADPGSDWPALAAVCAGSLVGGATAFHVGRWLSNVGFIERFVARSRRRVDGLFERYGIWAVAVASVTPVPFSFWCYITGAYRMRYRVLAMLALFRIPRLLVFYALLRTGWSLW